MDQRTDHLRRDIDATRDSMTEKLAQIEDKVKGTVDDFKGTVNDTVDQVKQAFDLNQQVQERPWTMLGASVLAGYVLGSMGGDDKPASAYRYGDSAHSYNQFSTPQSSAQIDQARKDYSSPPSSMGATNNAQPGFLDDVMDQFRDELDTLKGAAVATLSNMLRDMLKKNLPQFSEEFERARSERDQQNQQGASANQTYDPLVERVAGSSNDPSYQTYASAPDYASTTASNSTYIGDATSSQAFGQRH